MYMTGFGRHPARVMFFLASVITIVAVQPLHAQQAASQSQETQQQIEALRQRLDRLDREAAAIRDALSRLSVTTQAGRAEADDLTAVETVTSSPPTAVEVPADPDASQSPGDGSLDPQVIANPSNARASKVFNPDISVVANFLGHAGDTNPFDPRESVILDEAEIAFEAFVDPYAKAKFFFSAGPEGVELEEGYATFIALPFDLTAKVGKMKALFGKANTWHPHVSPWVDQPLVISGFLGGEGLNDSGISVSKLFPNSFAYTEGTLEVFRGRVDGVFDAEKANDLFYNAHLKFFRDLSENSNFELGTSFARGTAERSEDLPAGGGSNQFAGLDLTYRWKPLSQSDRSFIGRAELIANDRSGVDGNAFGFYTAAQYQFARRWFAGLRLDRAERSLDPSVSDRGISAIVTFWPSEFSQLRGQIRRTKYGKEETSNEVLLQLLFAIGAHGAHTF